MSNTHILAGSLVLLALPGLTLSTTAAAAETPAFDRPGISFSTTILPAGSVAWEQGLPDFEHDSDGGDRYTLYSANTNIRVGLNRTFELQIGTALLNHLNTKIGGVSDTESGIGDSSLAIKGVVPTSTPGFSVAVLGAVTFATGKDAFTADETVFDIGTTLGWDLSDKTSAAFYINATRLDDDTIVTVSPSLSFALNDRLGAFIEAGASFSRDSEDSSVAGGGFTWMLTPKVQLDISADFGLDDDTPDVTGGLGFSVFLE